MNIRMFFALAISSVLMSGCQTLEPITSSASSPSVREDNALYNQLDLFVVKNGGIIQKNEDGLTLLTPFFNEDVDYVSVAEREYLEKLGVFLTGTTIKKIKIIGYIEPRSSESEMTKTLENIDKMFSANGVSAPIGLTLGYPLENNRQEKRFQFDIFTN